MNVKKIGGPGNNSASVAGNPVSGSTRYGTIRGVSKRRSMNTRQPRSDVTVTTLDGAYLRTESATPMTQARRANRPVSQRTPREALRPRYSEVLYQAPVTGNSSYVIDK